MGHTSQKDLKQILDEAKSKVKIGGKYFHHKYPDQFYTLLDVAMIEASEEAAAIYRAEYDEEITWIRPIEEFLLEVENEDGTKGTKFTLVEE